MADTDNRIFLSSLMNQVCKNATMSLNPQDNMPYLEKEFTFVGPAPYVGDVGRLIGKTGVPRWEKVKTDASYSIVSAERLINREYAQVYDLSGNILQIIIEGITQDNIGHHLLLKHTPISYKYELMRDITQMYNRYRMYSAVRETF